jgi:tyrosyl-tRNA synthetase
MGRRLQEECGQEPQICVTLPILRGLDGERRMGKSLGNYIGVGMAAQEQFDKTMSIPDTLLTEWFTLLTDRPSAEVQPLIDMNPFEAKKTLAADIVCFYHGAEAAKAARAEWERVRSQRQDPTDIPEAQLPASSLADGKMPAFKLLAELGMAASNAEARRIIAQGGMNVGEGRDKISDPYALIEVKTGLIVRAGKIKIVRVRVV